MTPEEREVLVSLAVVVAEGHGRLRLLDAITALDSQAVHRDREAPSLAGGSHGERGETKDLSEPSRTEGVRALIEAEMKAAVERMPKYYGKFIDASDFVDDAMQYALDAVEAALAPDAGTPGPQDQQEQP